VQPASQTVPPGASVTFAVTATGTPAPTYQWFRNGQTFPGWDTPALGLGGVTANDAGAYWVVVANAAGSVTSQTAFLSLGASP
jgi:hypothetical protein